MKDATTTLTRAGLQGLASNRYAIELAARMQRLGFQVAHTNAGRSFELTEIPAHVRYAFSKRRQHLLERADAYFPGAEQRPNAVRTSALRRRMAALMDRPRKVIEPAHVQHVRWADEARELGLTWTAMRNELDARRATARVIGRDVLLDLVLQHVLSIMAARIWVSCIQLEQMLTAVLMGLCDAVQAQSVYCEAVELLLDSKEHDTHLNAQPGWVLKNELRGMRASDVAKVFRDLKGIDHDRQPSRCP
jgi:hypothetical protein